MIKVHLGVRCPENIKSGIVLAAEAKGITVSDFVIGCVFDRLVAEGFMTSEGDLTNEVQDQEPGVSGGASQRG
jgi:hypothetical protein